MEMKNNKLNVFAMDWNPTAANKLYPIPAKKTRKVGHEIAKYIHKLGIKADKVICIGHSLGAHVCGGFGEQYIKLEAKIYKIWGLDPANPMFNGKNDFRLCKEHAHLVEVIHTNGGDLGIKKAIGHFDFYLNNGTFF